jgi:hypothetical protein
MTFQIVRTFRVFAAAERARDELLAAGFRRDAVELTVIDDEAGPEQGNFTVGDNPKVKGGEDYSRTFAHDPAASHDHCVIKVVAADRARLEQAEYILAQHGATDIDATTRRRAQSDTPDSP